MALRIKSRWHDDGAERSVDEIASALAFISWRIAKDKAINLHGEDYIYDSDEQRMDVIVEYLIFQLQIVDRLALAPKEVLPWSRHPNSMRTQNHLSPTMQWPMKPPLRRKMMLEISLLSRDWVKTSMDW